MAEWKKVIVSGSSPSFNTVNARGHILPVSDDASDLGSSSKKFKDLYIDGTGNFDSVNIDGGTIDGTDITVGTGKALDVSGGTLTLANDQISGDKINGGTIGSVTISQLAGALDANSQAITNVDINSGAIDGASIGSASPDTGAFTSLSATLNTSLNGDVNLGNALTDDINVAGHITGSASANVSMSLASTGSFGQLHATKLFGDGANITGIAFQIDGLSNDLTSLDTGDLLVAADVSDGDEEKKITFGNLKAGIVDSINGQVNVDASAASTLAVSAITEQTNMTGDVADADELLINDNGALKRIDFSVLRDAVFNDVSGDIGIAAGGSVTIAANSVALGNDTTGNFMTDVSAGTGISVTHTPGEGSTATIATNDGAIVHDNLSGFVANEHIDHSGVTITAGAGLTGGGDITSTRTLDVVGGTGVTVSADAVAIGQDVATNANVTFANITATGNLTVEGNTVNAQVSNLLVEDRFALFNSGSSDADGGIIIQTESDFSGVALGWDHSAQRFSTQVATKLAQDAVAIAPDAYVASVVADGSDAPAYRKNGNIRVDGSGDIHIYVE